jgi:O-antigen/teichoic acid export membrane protein
LKTGESGLGPVVASLGGVNGVAFLAGIIRQKVFAVFLGTAGYGALSLAMSFQNLLVMTARLGLSTGLLKEMRHGIVEERWDRAARAYLSARTTALLIGSTVGLVIILLGDPINRIVFRGVLPVWAVWVVAVSVPAVLLAEIAESGLNALGRIRRLVLSKLLTILAGLSLAVFLVVGFALQGAIAQLLTGALVAATVAPILLSGAFRPRTHAPERIPRAEARTLLLAMLTVGLAQVTFKLAQAGNEMLFRSLIVRALGESSNGLYQGAMGISRQYVMAVMGGVFVYLFPKLSGLRGKRAEFQRELDKSLRFLVAISTPLCFLWLAFRDWIVLLVFTPEFLPMVPLVSFTAPGDVLAFLAGGLRFAALASLSPWAFGALSLGGEASYLAFFLLGLQYFGLSGAVGSYLLAMGVHTLLLGVALWFGGQFRLSGSLGRQLLLAGGVLLVFASVNPESAAVKSVALLGAGAWAFLWRKDLKAGFEKTESSTHSPFLP